VFVSVIADAYRAGVSTRRVEQAGDLVRVEDALVGMSERRPLAALPGA
jgi:hypothetical protein